ncbi:hypothetical protein EBR43_10425 [bacterium]|nr:hypothetical protein [bacterium]
MAKININMNSLKEKKDWKRHSINQGDNIYRILPPFGESADGYPYRRWVLVWLSDPQTGRLRPYASPFSFGHKHCPIYEYVSAVETALKEEEARLFSSGEFSKEEIKENLKPVMDVLWKIKPKQTYLYNACNKSGEIGLLELKKTAHDAMKKNMMQYVTDYGQDPTSLNSTSEDSGVWFKVTRTGEKTKTEYFVSKNQVKLRDQNTGKISWVDDQEPLPDNVVENYNDLGYDLSSVYREVSYDELKEVLLANLGSLLDQHPALRVQGFNASSGQVRGRSNGMVEEEQENEDELRQGNVYANTRAVRVQTHDVGNNNGAFENKTTKHPSVLGSGVPGRQVVHSDLSSKKHVEKNEKTNTLDDEEFVLTQKTSPKVTTKFSQDDVFEYADHILNS